MLWLTDGRSTTIRRTSNENHVTLGTSSLRFATHPARTSAGPPCPARDQPASAVQRPSVSRGQNLTAVKGEKRRG
jgi:hypothetical protein